MSLTNKQLANIGYKVARKSPAAPIVVPAYLAYKVTQGQKYKNHNADKQSMNNEESSSDEDIQVIVHSLTFK